MTTAANGSARDRELVLTRVFDAPRRLVFKAWTEGEHLARWCAPKGFTIPRSEGDIRPGGAWRSSMRSPDGAEYRLSGVYREIVPDERLVFTHAWEDENGRPGPETLVTVTFADRGDRTELTLRQTGFGSAASRDGHREGWAETLDSLADYLAAQAGTEGDRTARRRRRPGPVKLDLTPGACSLADHIALREAGIGFEPVRVDLETARTETGEDFAAINPKGYVPALMFDDGQVLTENVAILDWVADRAPQLRPGGEAWRTCIRSPDGKGDWSGGVLREVVAPQRLVFTFAWDAGQGRPALETLVTATFEEVDGKTRMTFRQAPFGSVAERDGHRQGWSECFDKLAAFLAEARRGGAR